MEGDGTLALKVDQSIRSGGFWTLHHFTLHFLTRTHTWLLGEKTAAGDSLVRRRREDPVNHDFALIKQADGHRLTLIGQRSILGRGDNERKKIALLATGVFWLEKNRVLSHVGSSEVT